MHSVSFTPNHHTTYLPALRGLDTTQVAAQLMRPVDSTLEEAKARYLSITRFAPESLIRFEKTVSGFCATINPAVCSVGKFAGHPYIYLGLIVDPYTVWELEALID